MLDMENLLEQIEVLQSIYPELQIEHTDKAYKFSITKGLLPSIPLKFELIGNGMQDVKVFDSFECSFVEGLQFTGSFPICCDRFKVISSWIDDAITELISRDISEMIRDSEKNDDTVLYGIFDFFMNEVTLKHEEVIYSNFTIQTTSSVQFESFKRMAQRARLDDFNNNRYTCSICLDSKEGKESGILLDCDHAFCKECLVEYCTQVINNEDTIKLQCPNCPMIEIKNLSDRIIPELKHLLFTDRMAVQVLKDIDLENELITKYEKLLELSRFEKFKSVYPFSCSECPRCTKWIFRDNVDDKLMHCNYCKFAYCFDCNHSWHGKNNACGLKINTIPLEVVERVANDECSEFALKKFQTVYGKHNLKLSVDSFLADRLFYETVQENDELVKCPNCNTVITKSDGCNKMKCSVCSENFCYLCGKSLTKENPYEHYNDVYSDCHGRLFEGMPGTEED